MNRAEYEAYKVELVDANIKMIDQVPPAATLPELFVEEITAFEITEDKLWHDAKGELVKFGGRWDSTKRKHVNQTVMLNPSFATLAAEAAGISIHGHPEIEKQRSYYDLITASGKVIKSAYVSRVVGRITFRKMDQSGAPSLKAYTTERDIDVMFDEANIKDLEKIGAVDKWDNAKRVMTEADTDFHTGNAARDSMAVYKKLLELGHHAYQTVDTKLRGHGVEKAIGFPAITESMIGGVVLVSRISYDPDNPAIKKLLALGAVQSIVGGTPAGQKLIEGATVSQGDVEVMRDDDAESESESEPENRTPEASAPAPSRESETSRPAEPLFDSEQAAESPVVDAEAVITAEWMQSEMVDIPEIRSFVNACLERGEPTAVFQWINAGFLAAQNGDDEMRVLQFFSGAAKNCRFLLALPNYEETAAKFDKATTEATYDKNMFTALISWLAGKIRKF